MNVLKCPSCGGDVPFKSKITLYVGCPYCGSMVVRKGMDVERVGTVGELHDDGSPIQLGTRGQYQKRSFEVIGRLQARYPAGYWNEWYLTFGGEADGWLGEAQGRYMVTFAKKVSTPIPPFAELKIGMPIRLSSEEYTVRTLDRSRVVGVEGELPFEAKLGYDADLADLATPSPRFASIDYSEDPPLVFIGEELDFDELGFSHLRELEGW